MTSRTLIDPLESRRLLAAAAFEWSMPERFGLDENSDTRIDLPNTVAYVNPDTFTANFRAATPRRGAAEIVDYRWSIFPAGRGTLGVPLATLSGAEPSAQLPEGAYNVLLRTTDANDRSRSVRRKIVVDDVLVVSLGDSYASGEGNPEVPSNAPGEVQWAWSPDVAARDQHRLAHRSTKSGSAQAALELERRDPRSSVTFVSLAQSGATVVAGLLGESTAADDADVTLPAQLDQLAGLVGDRAVDFITISIGGNDVGFVDLALELLREQSSAEQLQQLENIARSRLDTLADALVEVNDRLISTLGPRLKRVLLTEYPDLVGDDSGAVGDPVLEVFSNQIDRTEGTFARANIFKPLNRTLVVAARQNRWRFVGGIAAGSRTHGLPADDSYFVTIGESLGSQGSVFGAIHPNEKGHALIARRLGAGLR